MLKKISVIIPTCGRGSLVMSALDSLCHQEFREFEVIVVDNDCSDELKEKIENYDACYPLRYVGEAQKGLQHARHRGAREAKAEVLVYTDDDATFSPGWLAAYTAAFNEHPEMMGAGGPVVPDWEDPPEQWLVDYMKMRYKKERHSFSYFSLMKCGDEFSLSPENFFFGVNMAIRKEVLTRFGFHPELVGKRNDGDGEWGFLREMKDAGMLIGYCPLALVHHLIPHRRMSIKFIRKWADHHAASATFAEYWQQSIKRFTIARDAFSCAMQVVRSAYKFLRCYHRTEPWAIDLTYRHCYQKRRFLYLVRVMLDTKLRRLLRQPNFSPF